MKTTDQIVDQRPPASQAIFSATFAQALREAFSSTCSSLSELQRSRVPSALSDRSHIEAESPHEADRQIRRLINFKCRQKGWDGREAEPPNPESLGAAIHFLQSLKSLPLPIPMASVGSDGNATLYWKSDKFYADVELYEDGRVGYLLQVGDQAPEDNEVDMPERGIPPSIFSALIASTPFKNR